jgi:hypothetical protein
VKNILIYSLLLVSTISTLKAQSTSSSLPTEYLEENIKSPDVTSSEIRQTKNMELLVLHGYEYREVANQVALGFYLNSNNILSVRGGKESSTEFGSRQLSLATQWKHFFSNNLYITPEIYYLKFYDDLDAQSRDDQITALGAGVRIGTQWQWKYLTIGIDLVGVGYNLIYFKDEINKSGVDKLSYNVANIYAGINF